VANLVTYAFVGEGAAKLKANSKLYYKKLVESAKIACNFWNGHITPKQNIVLQIDVFDGSGTTTIARTYKPFEENGTRYVKIEYSSTKIWFTEFVSIVLIHEIGHGLGFGWESLEALYDKATGKFHQQYVDEIPELAEMEIELNYGPATRYAHWDEEKFGNELMTGFSAVSGTYVLPVTIRIMKLLGHKLDIVPSTKLKLNDKNIRKLGSIKFDRQKDVELIDVFYERETEKMEEIESKPWWQMLLDWILS
jgi:hypothetical protein